MLSKVGDDKWRGEPFSSSLLPCRHMSCNLLVRQAAGALSKARKYLKATTHLAIRRERSRIRCGVISIMGGVQRCQGPSENCFASLKTKSLEFEGIIILLSEYRDRPAVLTRLRIRRIKSSNRAKLTQIMSGGVQSQTFSHTELRLGIACERPPVGVCSYTTNEDAVLWHSKT